jgi:hypothetical protein
MPRKRWTAKEEITPALLKFREKRKWQIALRRYVIDGALSIPYAPYFGLDNKNMRKWFEIQLAEGVKWDDFGKKWQFEHVVPVTCFDFSKEEELKMCWSFINIRTGDLQDNIERISGLDLQAAKLYFKELFNTTQYRPCQNLMKKIEEIEAGLLVKTEAQQQFIKENQDYLDTIDNYSAFEFELLNSGRSQEEIAKEVAFLKGL